MEALRQHRQMHPYSRCAGLPTQGSVSRGSQSPVGSLRTPFACHPGGGSEKYLVPCEPVIRPRPRAMVPIVYMTDIHINIVMLHTENPLSMHFVMDKGIFLFWNVSVLEYS